MMMREQSVDLDHFISPKLIEEQNRRPIKHSYRQVAKDGNHSSNSKKNISSFMNGYGQISTMIIDPSNFPVQKKENAKIFVPDETFKVRQSVRHCINEDEDSLLIDYQDNLDDIDCNYYINQCNNAELKQSKPDQTASKLIGDIKGYSQDSRYYNVPRQTQLDIFKSTNQDSHLSDWEKRKSRRYHGAMRRYVSKRIYLCGTCVSSFNFAEELSIHIKNKHRGEIPDGTIFGFKKEILFKFFHIPLIKPVQTTPKKVYMFKCGCGRDYTCSSSLFYHIKAVHNGIGPEGTIGILHCVRIQ